MAAPLVALALVPLLAAAAPGAPQPPPQPRPRSSIAAVIARRGELGLGDAVVRQLEERDAALQRQRAEIREGLGRRPAAGGARRGGGGRGGDRGGPRGARPEDPAARAAELQRRLDDADTAAWLGAEQLLPEGQRAAARAVAEKYREALADDREGGRVGR